MTDALWSYTAGNGTSQVQVKERAEKGGVVYAYWRSPAYAGRSPISTGLTIRNAKGAVIESRRAEAVKRADRAADAKAAGADDEALRLLVRGLSPIVGHAVPKTLSEALDAAIGKRLPAGQEDDTAPVWTSHRIQDRAVAWQILDLLGDRAWVQMSDTWYRELWRKYARLTVERNAERLKQERAPISGQRQARKLIRVLARAARYMNRKGVPSPLPDTHALNLEMEQGWDPQLPTPLPHARLKKELRYADDEVGAILAALDRPGILDRVDPRLVVALRIGAERRIGQVLRLRFSHLEKVRSESGFAMVAWIPGVGKKSSGPVLLLESEWDAIRAMKKRLYQRYYQRPDAQVAVDYAIFPGGQLRHLHRTGPIMQVARTEHLWKDYRALEELAGVPHKAGRGWYGLRRSLIDIAQELKAADCPGNPLVGSSFALNILSGHITLGMREGTYLDPSKDTMLVLLSEIRRAARAKALAAFEGMKGRPIIYLESYSESLTPGPRHPRPRVTPPTTT